MSGGHFEYKQIHLAEIRESIDALIRSNNSLELNEYGDQLGRYYSEKTIDQFKIASVLLKFAEIYATRIDWLVSADISEDNFHKQLQSQLNDAIQ